MRSTRTFVLVALLVVIVAGTWYALSHRPRSIGSTLTVYYTKLDGTSLGRFGVSLRPPQPGESAAEHLRNAVLYAAVQAVAGPPSDVAAIRFPAGTRVVTATVTGSTATVDLSNDVERQAGGTFGENGEFKALVYTVTGIPGIGALKVTVGGATLPTLPGDILNWINRSIVRIFSALALVAVFAAPAAADAPITASYERQPIRFTRLSQNAGALAIGVEDPGLRALLRAIGATLTWQPGDRYVMITTAVPQVVTFAIGDRRYDVGPIALQAAFAPYRSGSEVYLPLDELLHAMDLALRRDGAAYVLQPQLDALDVRTAGNRADVIAHGGAPLRPRVTAQSAGEITYEFDGVGTSLPPTRIVDAGGIHSVQIAQSGTVADPKTIVTIALLPGAVHDVPRSNDERDVVISFAGSGGAAQPAPPVASGAPGPGPGALQAAPNSGATVTGVTVAPSSDGELVSIAIAGTAEFEWHRLRDPDNRFWVDVKGAQLQGRPVDTSEPDPVGGLRVRQIDPQTVRVALSLTGPKNLSVTPTAGGLNVDVDRTDVDDASQMARTGRGSVGATIASSEEAAPVTPAPGGGNGLSTWKFGTEKNGGYAARNPRLIVIDPGHGGSDRGSSRHGVDEATLTLDVSRRLRDILIARGWQVRLTHDKDVDVYAPNDSAHDELQARDDVANNAGARMLISIHANAFVNSGPYGTTCYISKPSDLALAQIIERQLAGDGTKDDGIVKSHLYVTLHALMPAVLIETAFISNPNDFALLTSPQWRQKIAQEIADGIDQYDRQYPATGGGQ